MRNILFFAAQGDSLKIKGAFFSYVSLIQSIRFLTERSLLTVQEKKKTFRPLNQLKFSIRSEKNISSVSSEASCKEKAISCRYLFLQLPFLA